MAASTASPDVVSGAPLRPASSSMNARSRIGFTALLALGATLARRGLLAVVSMVVSALTALVLAVLAIAFARRGRRRAGGERAPARLERDRVGRGHLAGGRRRDGRAQARSRGGHPSPLRDATTSLRGYLVARVGGLAAVLAVVVGGGTLLVSALAIIAAAQTQPVLRTVHTTFSALVFALAFAAVMAPVAFAALGARARLSGYLVLLLFLVVPELVASTLAGALPAR